MGWVHVFCKHMSDCQKKKKNLYIFMLHDLPDIWIFIFKLFFMCMNGLSSYMSVYHVHSVFTNTKEGVGCPGT